MISKNENILISKLLSRDIIYLNDDSTIYDAINPIAKIQVEHININSKQLLLLDDIFFIS